MAAVVSCLAILGVAACTGSDRDEPRTSDGKAPVELAVQAGEASGVRPSEALEVVDSGLPEREVRVVAADTSRQEWSDRVAEGMTVPAAADAVGLTRATLGEGGPTTTAEAETAATGMDVWVGGDGLWYDPTCSCWQLDVSWARTAPAEGEVDLVGFQVDEEIDVLGGTVQFCAGPGECVTEELSTSTLNGASATMPSADVVSGHLIVSVGDYLDGPGTCQPFFTYANAGSDPYVEIDEEGITFDPQDDVTVIRVEAGATQGRYGTACGE